MLVRRVDAIAPVSAPAATSGVGREEDRHVEREDRQDRHHDDGPEDDRLAAHVAHAFGELPLSARDGGARVELRPVEREQGRDDAEAGDAVDRK
jgi:hypothetical protein